MHGIAYDSSGMYDSTASHALRPIAETRGDSRHSSRFGVGLSDRTSLVGGDEDYVLRIPARMEQIPRFQSLRLLVQTGPQRRLVGQTVVVSCC